MPRNFWQEEPALVGLSEPEAIVIRKIMRMMATEGIESRVEDDIPF